jgi:hypothetical protein
MVIRRSFISISSPRRIRPDPSPLWIPACAGMTITFGAIGISTFGAQPYPAFLTGARQRDDFAGIRVDWPATVCLIGPSPRPTGERGILARSPLITSSPPAFGYGIHGSPTRSRPLDGGGTGWG